MVKKIMAAVSTQSQKLVGHSSHESVHLYKPLAMKHLKISVHLCCNVLYCIIGSFTKSLTNSRKTTKR